ncbi:MAG: YaaA family protein [Bacteroidales bacterium]
MQILLSPAKILDLKSSSAKGSTPSFNKEANELVHVLREKNVSELKNILKVATDKACWAKIQYDNWGDKNRPTFRAIDLFAGVVFKNLEYKTLDIVPTKYIDNHLFILSALYGVLRSTDVIQPYRIEMNQNLESPIVDNLYDFWKSKITNIIRGDKNYDGLIFNLASQEYASVIDFKKLGAHVISPQFKETQGDKYKTVVVYTKQARGKFCRFLAENNTSNPEHIKAFDYDGYHYNNELSTELVPVYTR